MQLFDSPRIRSNCLNGDAGAIALAQGEVGAPSAGNHTGLAASSMHQFTDPIADVLEWLGRYDFREDVSSSARGSIDTYTVLPPSGYVPDAMCNDSVNDETPAKEKARVQLPREGSTIRTYDRGKFVQPRSDVGHPSGATNSMSSGASPIAPKPVAIADPGRCSSMSQLAAAWAWCRGGEEKTRDFFDEEEEEWNQRQKKSGTVGRLVSYHAGDTPQEDVVLRGGGRHHIIVAGIRESGQAARVGVRAGDRLVSINGKKDFLGQSADYVRERLEAPIVLVFLGFVGKLQAEVRLTCADHVCGISSRHEAVRGSSDAPVQLCEERVFNAGIASLFLTVHDRHEDPDDERSGDNPTSPASSQPMFELQHREAHGLVKRALRRLEVKEMISKAAAGEGDPDVTTAMDMNSRGSPVPPLKLEGSPVPTLRMLEAREAAKAAERAKGTFAPRAMMQVAADQNEAAGGTPLRVPNLSARGDNYPYVV